jgi:hypothetical protein
MGQEKKVSRPRATRREEKKVSGVIENEGN